MGEHLSTFQFIEVEIDYYRARLDTLKENGARPAIAEMTYTTTGVGQQRVKAPLIFPVVFRNEPHFTNGSGVIKNPKPDLWHDPIGTVGIYRWKRTPKGYFTGAYIWWRVDAYAADPLTIDYNGEQGYPAMKVEHFLTFSGTAFKDLDRKTMDSTVTPRTPGKPN